MPLVPLQKKRLDAISDATVEAIDGYPGDPLDVAHVLLCAAIQTMVRSGLERRDIGQLVSLVIDDDDERRHGRTP